MHYTPLEMQECLQIGQVDFVSPDEIKIALDIETPENVSLSTGMPRAFPRINSYVLIRTEEGSVVAQVEWITVERSNYPKRKGLSDFGLIDLPYPLRKMSVNPLGVLKQPKDGTYEFHRGVNVFPSVGDAVHLPTEEQLRAIIESGNKKNVQIGTSPFAESAKVCIDPDKLFGRHLAVLGNTGSGKSCSVAGLVRWSLEEAKKSSGKEPHARFIILDPNGEYKKTFSDLGKVHYFSVNGVGESGLHIPLWFWNTKEWCAFTQATAKTQRPTIINTLRCLRMGVEAPIENIYIDTRRLIATYITTLRCEILRGNPWGSFPHPKNFHKLIEKWNEGLTVDDRFSDNQNDALNDIKHLIDEWTEKRTGSHVDYTYSKKDVDTLMSLLENAHGLFGGIESDVGVIDADIPRPFSQDSFLKCLAANGDILGTSEYITSMEARIQALLMDKRMNAISAYEGKNLDEWLNTYIGNDETKGSITVVDMSLVPAELIHILTSVISRMTFEALQRYRKLNKDGKCLPTVLVMEEAHTFIKRYTEDSENQSAAEICCQVFEKIAREGRKFGLGLVLSSQRPSELSPTVLSQCNTFLLHRISNDKDQELVLKLVPDNQRGLLRDLPSLPSQNAILLGWASELPMLVKMRTLPDEQRPQSDDPDFWDVWTGKKKRPIDWDCVATDWQSNC